MVRKMREKGGVSGVDGVCERLVECGGEIRVMLTSWTPPPLCNGLLTHAHNNLATLDANSYQPVYHDRSGVADNVNEGSPSRLI